MRIDFSCSDLAEFGLRLVPAHSPEFQTLIREARRTWVASLPERIPEFSAMLINDTGQSIRGMTKFWKWTYADRRGVGTATVSPLTSTEEVDVLIGREPILHWASVRIIFAGSKRLITPEGVCGDNSDVLATPMRAGPEPSSCFSFGFGSWLPEEVSSINHVQLQLDSAVLEDGLCIGPDEARTFENLTIGVEEWRPVARKLRSDLEAGSSRDALIETVQPYHRFGTPPRDPKYKLEALVTGYAGWAKHLLGHVSDDSKLIEWLKSFEMLPPRDYRRASLPGQ